MSGVKDVLKGGWHPTGKDGAKESWRGDYKGINQVAGWVGKSKKKPGQQQEGGSHVSRPLATLKDPGLFGPPPKNVNFHGAAALPNDITPHTGGIGAPLTPQEMTAGSRYAVELPAEEVQEQEAARPAPPPLPYRSDHTGLRTDNLPPPPARRDDHNAPEPRLPSRAMPNLPPRLPSRQNTASSPVGSASPPPSYESTVPTELPTPTLNQSAMNRLGSAGVSVPSLGIGRRSANNDNPWQNESSQNSTVSELSSRFKRFNSSGSTQSNSGTESATSPSEKAPRPTWAQTQSSLRTAQNFHRDPSSVSLADAQQAATTAQQAHNNAQAFRAKHADKIDAAERKATAINKRYNMTGRLNKFLEDANNEHDQQQQQVQPPPLPPAHPNATAAAPTNAYQRPSPSPPIPSPPPPPQTNPPDPESLTKSIGRKPPPPPPPKKPSSLQAPPPIPLGTRPTFS